jgi:hypothetical protein
MNNTYKLKNDHKNCSSLKYFSDHPISEWSFIEFEAAVNKDKLIPPNATKTKKTYFSIMRNIQDSSTVPGFVKTEVHRLLSSLESPKTKSQNISFSIIANDSSVINTLGTGTFISDQQRQSTEVTLYQEEDFEPIADSAHFYDEEDDEEDKIPSNLSIDHHPKRTCDYILTFTESDTDPTDTEAAADGSKWILNDTCISDLCFNLKNTTVQLVKHLNPAQLSDIRFLVLNDVYIFDRNFVSSDSKCFSTKIHITLKPTLSLMPISLKEVLTVMIRA